MIVTADTDSGEKAEVCRQMSIKNSDEDDVISDTHVVVNVDK